MVWLFFYNPNVVPTAEEVAYFSHGNDDVPFLVNHYYKTMKNRYVEVR